MTNMIRHGIALMAALGSSLGVAAASIRLLRSRGRTNPEHAERGDVPGWVMITLMSAVLVAALLALAGPALEAMFNQAMDTVGK
ncbi:hypothetical protein [Arthrobacter sp. D1-17]